MSESTTLSGANVATQFTPAATGSAAAALNQLAGLSFSVDSVNGLYTVPGAVFVEPPVTSATITGATVVVSNAPNANLTVTTSTSEIFAAPGDTISATGADTLFGASAATTGGADNFISTGANSSIVGGTGDLDAMASGANTTLIGGTGTNNFTVSGAGSDAVAGPAPGITNVTLTDTGGAQIATNPLGNSGTLIATLSTTGADSVIGGGGASTITGGGGADVFGFVDGHAGGTETILNFTTNDTFAFDGYGSNPISTEMYTAGANGAGTDVITLTDGTTITVEGQFSHSIFGKDS
jgi:hypothetical protein